MLTGRFAPSPSGRMHLGNVFSALLAWLSVRSRNGRMLLRIEDLDPDRCRPDYIETLKRDLGVPEVIVNYVGPVVGAHSGPGTIALFFWGSER